MVGEELTAYLILEMAGDVYKRQLIDRAPLTEKQQNVYESIMQYQRVNAYAPTIREICKMVGVASTSSGYAHLDVYKRQQLDIAL